MVDAAGAVLEQYTWDPYGSPLYVDTYAAHEPNRIGHQGLFFDRLDAAATNPQLAAGGTGLYQNRNRTYSPGLGRFLQMDPNGTGLGVTVLGQSSLRWTPTITPLTADSLYQDGMSFYSYVDSSPTMRSDATGLFMTFIDAGMTGLDMALDAVGAMDEAYMGVGIKLSFELMINSAAFESALDVDWADDWSDGDHSYSKAGATGAVFAGARLARLKGKQWHHIATKEHGRFTGEFERMFKSAGMSLNDPANRMYMPHGGRHAWEYHEYVRRRLNGALEGVKGQKARAKVIRRELGGVRNILAARPGWLYDTVKGKPTGFRGTRLMRLR